MTIINFSKNSFTGRTAKEKNTVLNEVTSENGELKKQIAALQKQLKKTMIINNI